VEGSRDSNYGDGCCLFFFSSRRRHTRSYGDWSSDVCSSDLAKPAATSRSTGAMCSWRRASRTMCALTKSGFREGMLPNKRLKLKIGRASCRERVEVVGGEG